MKTLQHHVEQRPLQSFGHRCGHFGLRDFDLSKAANSTQMELGRSDFIKKRTKYDHDTKTDKLEYHHFEVLGHCPRQERGLRRHRGGR